MRGMLLRILSLAGVVLTFGACQDAPMSPDARTSAADLTVVEAPDEADQSPSCCDPVIVVVPGPGTEDCDPYMQLDNSCDDGGGGQCITSTGDEGGELQTVSGCPDPGSGGSPSPGGPCYSASCGGGDGGAAPPDDGDLECVPAIHPECEKPLTPEDLATIDSALNSMMRPAAEFTDSIARQQCEALENRFRLTLAEGAVFRGAFDSNRTNTPQGSHAGYTSPEANIHFDPTLLDAANAGNSSAIRQLAITALHEVGHTAGFQHGTPTWDAQGRDYYAERPFSRMNPGENSCVEW